jgi:hypothetical protein
MVDFTWELLRPDRQLQQYRQDQKKELFEHISKIPAFGGCSNKNRQTVASGR